MVSEVCEVLVSSSKRPRNEVKFLASTSKLRFFCLEISFQRGLESRLDLEFCVSNLASFSNIHFLISISFLNFNGNNAMSSAELLMHQYYPEFHFRMMCKFSNQSSLTKSEVTPRLQGSILNPLKCMTFHLSTYYDRLPFVQ